MISGSDERLVPERSDYETLWEHVARYAFACRIVKGLTALDIASGEGYGTYALSKSATSVIGVDIDEPSVERAREKYGLDYRVGTANKIPVVDASVDCVVSFETLEHLEDALAFLREVHRVLKPGGRLLLSTPNRHVYHAGVSANEYHVREYSLPEVCTLLGPGFSIAQAYGQSFSACPFDKLEGGIARISPWLRARFHQNVTSRLRSRFTPGVTTTSADELQNFIELIPSFHRSFLWWINRVGLRKIKVRDNSACAYFVVVAVKN